ncbi:MAG: acetylornithine deacetylase [Cellvibrionaceae bacterium]|jgi:acetylornithine deacetylase
MDKKRYLDQLSQLVATPSVSCTQASLDMSNRPVIDLLANWLEPLGFDIQIQTLPQQPEKANLIATLGRGNKGLVLSGHTDTVPFDAKLWQQDPFSLTLRDQRAYGLGATDMKGFFPTVIAALEPFLKTELKQPIIIVATADEESSMSGARALLDEQQPKARFAVIGEPTGMRPVHMHKGIMMEKIRIRGQAGHSSNPTLGNNALDAMHDVIGELKAFRQQLQSDYQHPGFEIPMPTLNLGCIHGGDNPNRICGSCELEFDLRPLPGMDPDNLREAIDKRLAPLAAQKKISIERQSLFPGISAFEQSKHSPLIETVSKLTEQDPVSVAFATEAPFFQQLGMDVVVMGPGSIDQAHQPDEFIDLSQIDPATRVLQQLISHVCCA